MKNQLIKEYPVETLVLLKLNNLYTICSGKEKVTRYTNFLNELSH